jgi:hypothetical protein
MCWPVGWAIVHVGTMAALQALKPPSINASLGELILGFATLAVVCLWPVVGTIGAPWMIANMVTSGTNFAQSMVGAFSSALAPINHKIFSQRCIKVLLDLRSFAWDL